METKVCNKCKVEKPVSEFNKNGKYYYSMCKECKREYRLANYERESKLGKERNKLNADHIREQKREYRKNSPVYKEYQLNRKEDLKEYNKRYYLENKDKINKQKNQYQKNKELINPLFKLRRRINNRIYLSITTQGYSKNKCTEEILGCSINEFKQHIESLWEPWMNWDNYGKYNGSPNYGWDIDHIIPNSSAINESEVYELNHYSNLQPLCSYVNRDIKRDS